eukprot:UC1_evm1s949
MGSAVSAETDLTSAAAAIKRGGAAAVESPLPPKRAKKKDRRKSHGRNQRRSIIDPRMRERAVALLHEDVPSDADAPERLSALLRLAFEAAGTEARKSLLPPSEKGDTTVALGPEEAAEVDRVLLNEFLGHVGGSSGVLSAATAVPRLQPNPKNAQMDENLEQYVQLRKRLRAEEEAWKRA